MFALRFDKSAIPELAARFRADGDKAIEREVQPRVWRRGSFSRPDFLAVCRWKSPRIVHQCTTNTDDFIESVTRTALTTKDERLRIEVLTLLNGVGWPTASALLHFGTRDVYPILDFRVLWSLGFWELPTYEHKFWSAYTSYCRALAHEAGVSMRVLDRALWQYSKDNQPGGPTQLDRGEAEIREGPAGPLNH